MAQCSRIPLLRKHKTKISPLSRIRGFRHCLNLATTQSLALNKSINSDEMISLQPCKTCFQSTFPFTPLKPQNLAQTSLRSPKRMARGRKLKCCGQEGEKKTERRTFLTLEEAGLVEISGLSTHERFLCRLTISSLNLLRVISEQEGYPIEELNAARVCDWFIKDKLKREQNMDSAVLQWDDSEFQL